MGYTWSDNVRSSRVSASQLRDRCTSPPSLRKVTLLAGRLALQAVMARLA
ncbi:MAG: hypothetical protein JWM31_2472, partial [Solirubrobacterales bacterium]|nr:hypothetical protein [Solirubrobacterales bacterium]